VWGGLQPAREVVVSRTARRAWLSFLAVLCATTLVLALRQARGETPRSLKTAPADWLQATQVVDTALDSESPRRVELWRAAYAHAKTIAPHRTNPDAAFVRSGLFHWYELGNEDRARVLKAAEPLMRDPAFFARMHLPLLQLTGDFPWLRRSAPPTLDTRVALRNLAMARGLFGEYRLLREELRRLRTQTFSARRRTDDPSTLLNLLPERVDSTYEPLVRGLLAELDRQAFDPSRISGRVEEVVDYALDHDLAPLTGVAPLLEAPSQLRDVTRARVALRLDRSPAANRIEMTSRSARGPEWHAYYLERARAEARRRDAAAANAYLVRAAADGMTAPVLAAAADVARILGHTAEERRYVAQLERSPRVWAGVCSAEEICTNARSHDWGAAARTRTITLSNVQSDEIPPYVEIYVDDVRLAEGEIRESRTFAVPLTPGLHEIEIRLVNTHTRNGAQRRLRLS
jgi:hypothetical protein